MIERPQTPGQSFDRGVVGDIQRRGRDPGLALIVGRQPVSIAARHDDLGTSVAGSERHGSGNAAATTDDEHCFALKRMIHRLLLDLVASRVTVSPS
jgi:hypothetical protein